MLPNKDEIPSLAQLKADASTIENLLSQAERHVTAFTAARAKLVDDFSNAYKTASKTAIDEVLGGKIMELKKGTREALDALLKSAGAPKARRDNAQDFLGDARVTVNVNTLGSPKRKVYCDNLKHAGHASIKAAAVFAVANGDQELVAALLDVLSSLPVSERPVSANDLVEKAPHPDFVAAKAAFFAFDIAFQRLILTRRTFLSPTASALGRVKLGLDEADDA